MTTFLGSNRAWALQLGAALLSLALAGCQNPFLKDQAPRPQLVTNTECAASCDLAKRQCEQRQRQREHECKQGQQIASAGAKRCDPRTSKHCLEPVSCLGPDMSICRTERSNCMRTCAEPAAAQSSARAEHAEHAEPDEAKLKASGPAPVADEADAPSAKAAAKVTGKD